MTKWIIIQDHFWTLVKNLAIGGKPDFYILLVRGAFWFYTAIWQPCLHTVEHSAGKWFMKVSSHLRSKFNTFNRTSVTCASFPCYTSHGQPQEKWNTVKFFIIIIFAHFYTRIILQRAAFSFKNKEYEKFHISHNMFNAVVLKDESRDLQGSLKHSQEVCDLFIYNWFCFVCYSGGKHNPR